MNAFFLVVQVAAAQALQVELDEAKTAQLGLDANSLVNQMNEGVSSQLKLEGQEDFLASMANASTIAARGMGVDYTDRVKTVLFGASFGTGVHGSGFSFGSGADKSDGNAGLPAGGFATQVTLMAGFDLGIFDKKEDSALDRFRFFAHGMAMPLPSGTPFSGSMYNVGLHAQIELIGGAGGKAVEWGGLDFTTGFSRATYRLNLKQGLPLTVPADDADLTWNAEGSFELVSASDVIPLELSTHLRVLVANVYLGGGADLATAGASSAVSLKGGLDAETQGQQEAIGEADLSLDADALGDALAPRAFVGLSANLLALTAYGQINIGFNQAYGGHLGVRVSL